MGTAHFKHVEPRSHAKESQDIYADEEANAVQLSSAVENTFGMIPPDDIENSPEYSEDEDQREPIHTGQGEEGDHELFAHIVPDDGETTTPPGLGVEAFNHPSTTAGGVDSQVNIERFASGAEVLAIEHDDPSDFNEYTYNHE